MVTATSLVTVEDLDLLPESQQHCELWRGVLHPMTATWWPHAFVVTRLMLALGGYVYARNLGVVFGDPAGMVFERGPDTVLCPDLAFIARGHLPERLGAGFLEVVPDLAVEVLSPSDRAAAMRRRVAFFLRHGVRLVWVVDPRRRTVRVHLPDGSERVLGESEELDGGEVIPGFRCPLAELFADLRR